MQQCRHGADPGATLGAHFDDPGRIGEQPPRHRGSIASPGVTGRRGARTRQGGETGHRAKTSWARNVHAGDQQVRDDGSLCGPPASTAPTSAASAGSRTPAPARGRSAVGTDTTSVRRCMTAMTSDDQRWTSDDQR